MYTYEHDEGVKVTDGLNFEFILWWFFFFWFLMKYPPAVVKIDLTQL